MCLFFQSLSIYLYLPKPRRVHFKSAIYFDEIPPCRRNTPYPSTSRPIMPEQLLYPSTRSQAKHVYTETEVRVISSGLGGCGRLGCGRGGGITR